MAIISRLVRLRQIITTSGFHVSGPLFHRNDLVIIEISEHGYNMNQISAFKRFVLSNNCLRYTVAVWTPKTFFPLLTRPQGSQGSQGCQKIRFFFLQMKMFSFCTKIAPRRHKLQKTIKIEEKMSINPCFLGLF